jgi:hypothetical protein
MLYRFSLLRQKGSICSIIFFISHHFKDSFQIKVDVRFWKSSVFLVKEAKIKLLITLIFFRYRSMIFFVQEKKI